MGGAVGLKGTDGSMTLYEAMVMDVKPKAALIATEALKELIHLKENLILIIFPGRMGGFIAKRL